LGIALLYMAKHRIALVTVGSLRARLDTTFLEEWHSEILEISHPSSIGSTPDATGPGWVYSDEELSRLIRPETSFAMTIAVVNAPLQQNYYARRLPGNLAVLSLFEMAEILSAANLPVEHFVLRAAYAYSVYFLAYNGRIPNSGVGSLSHHEIRGCLFDLNANKADIVESMDPPRLCEACRSRFATVQVPTGFLATLERELRRIRKPIYFRLSQWVQRHPLWAIVITGISGIILNVLSNAVYDAMKRLWK
jgi:hypothetical protein